MTTPDGAGSDLAYIRQIVESTGEVHVPAIYLCWAATALAGFTLADFSLYPWVPIYWMIAGPLGFVVSWRLSSRANLKAGVVNRKLNAKWAYHWAAFGAAGLLGIALPMTGALTWAGYGSYWVLLLALAYMLAGVHQERRLFPVGAIMGIGFLVSLYFPHFGWTAAGVLVAAALAVQGLAGRHRSV